MQVDVFSEETLTGVRQMTSTAFLTFVAIDTKGGRVRVPLSLRICSFRDGAEVLDRYAPTLDLSALHPECVSVPTGSSVKQG